MDKLHTELTELLYAILVRETDWKPFLSLLVSDLGNGGAQFMMQKDSSQGNLGRIEMGTGVEQKQIDDYTNYFSQRNPWLPDHILRRQDDVIVDHEVITREDLRRTEFYNDYLRPAGYNGSTGVTLSRRGGETMFLVTIFSDFEPEVASMVGLRLEALKPHLKRVMQHYGKIELDALPGSFATEALGILGSGLCMITDDLKPALITPAAEKAARENELFSVTPTGRIRLSDETSQKMLGQMLLRDYSGPTDRVWQQNGCRLTLYRASREPISELLNGPIAGLLIEPRQPAPQAEEMVAIGQRFGLTTAEMRVLDGIARGLSIRAMAEAFGRSPETVRSQVKSLLHKTGSENQLALMRLLSGR